MTPFPDHDEAVRERLRALRIDPPDAGFAAALHRRLAEAGPPPAPGLLARLRGPAWWRAPVLWPAAGLAVGVAAFLALQALRGPEAVRVPATRVAVIRLDLSADVAVQDARIQVQLPEGLVFWADGAALGERSFQWTQPLAAGENRIPIAVRGLRPGRYRVLVHAQAGGERIEHEVLLQVTDG